MKKNNKGFTLIELLAAIIILGLLTMLGLPTITRVIQGGKDKIYVSDAKRMIAQTEYKIKVNSSSIELPDEGSCIVIGLQYLDASDFDSPPNDGNYMLDQSYTIVKNTGTGLEYAVRLVEKMKKGGYKGVELSSQTALNVDSGLSRVKAFKANEVSKDMLNSGNDAFNDPIKDNLGDNYCILVNNVYDKVDLDDSSVQSGNEPPKITSVTMNPINNSSYNTLQADLVVKADDVDDGRGKLKVCTSLISSEDAMSHCENYGVRINGSYTKRYDFSTVNPPSSYGPEIENPEYKIFVYVKDPSGAYSKKNITYTVHKNEAPVINMSNTKVEKRPEDPFNGLTAMITLDVADDLDNVGDLNICIDQDDSNTCVSNDNNYQRYFDLFGNSNRMEYHLKNVDTLDGSSHSISIYVKDSMGEVSISHKNIYHLYRATGSSTQDGTAGSHITLTSVPYQNVNDNSLMVDVSFRLLESLGSVTNRDVIISERIGNSYVKPIKYRYNASTTSYRYLFGNKGNLNSTEYKYDGHKNRRLDVMVCPHDDTNPEHCNREEVGYDIYQNQSPKVYFGRFTFDDYDACPNGYVCVTENSLATDYIIDIKDDIDKVDDGANNNNVTNMLQYCISDSADDCSSASEFKYFKKTRNAFVSIDPDYSDPYEFSVYGKYKFTPNDILKPYDGSKRILYVSIKDSYGLITKVATPDYFLHENKAPYLDMLEITDHGIGSLQNGSKNISIKPLLYSNNHLYTRQDTFEQEYVSDDLTNNKDLAYKLYLIDDFGNEIVIAQLTREEINELKANPRTNWNNVLTFDKLLNNDYQLPLNNPDFLYNGLPLKYNGSILTFRLQLTDEYDVSSEYTIDYQLYSNKPPTVDRFEIASSSSACDSCGEGGGYTVDVDLSISDDMDETSSLSVCLDEDANSCSYEENYISYDLFFKDKIYKYTFRGEDGLTPYDGQTKTLHVSVRDSLLDKTYESLEYTVYKNQGPTILSDPIITSADSHYYSSEAIADVDVSDDLGNLYERVCFAEVDSEGNEITQLTCDGDYKPYNEKFKFNLGISNYQGKRYKIYVDIKDAYDVNATSNGILYTTYMDQTPVIDSVSGAYDVTGYGSGTGRVRFKAHDYGDTYKVCISTTNSSSGCSFNGNSYDGSKTIDYDYSYSFGSNSKTATYYMFIKDNHGKVSAGKSFTFSSYTQCNSVNNDMIKYEYVKEPNSSSNRNIISSDACSGRCYYWPEERKNGKVVKPASDTSKITARYKKTISYRDSFNENKYCNSSTEIVNLNCGSVQCFNDGSTYTHTAIGLVDYIATEAWTFTFNGYVYSYPIGSHYYKVYTTSYVAGSEYVTLYDTSNKVPIDMINKFKYDCEESGCIKYYRVLDKNETTSDYVNKAVTFKYKVTNPHTTGTISAGDTVQAGTEEFYVVSSDSTTTKLFAKYNLHHGSGTYGQVSPTYNFGLQDVACVGSKKDFPPSCFERGPYFDDYESITSYPYNFENIYRTFCYDAYDMYKDKLEEKGLLVRNVRSITYNEISTFGCTTSYCPNWLTYSSYWIGTAPRRNVIYAIKADHLAVTSIDITDQDSEFGCRPLIEVSTKEIDY